MLFGHARVRVAEIMRDNVQGNAGHDHMARRRVTDNMEPGRRRDVRRAAGLGHQESAFAVTVHLPWVRQVPGGSLAVRLSGHTRRFL